ncbi:hypothetical protein CAEBREN_19311 [Caenorhabditis brenneri]|uniref:Uncharacterized protein n=1 Tax=Caenorhabditis brenneri TaxID=135651 RepID=G0NPJ6_CAEBE|nr:hypothetical protein CAEBREN_19311 [Caenorhabditis brenneri]
MFSLHFLSLLFFTILLSSGISALEAHYDTTNSPPTPKCGLPPAELDELVKKLNDERIEVAEKEQIANMHEIRYDPELEKLAASCAREGGSGCSSGGTSRGHPTQTGFAFCYTKTSIYVTLPDKTHEEKMIPTRFYVYGPNITKPEDKSIKGPPGSQCPNGKTESGLCKASWHVDPQPPVSAPMNVAQPTTEEPNHGAKVSYLISSFFLLILLVGTYSESDFKMGKPGSDCPNGVVPPETPNGACESNCGLCIGPEVPVKTTTARTIIQSKEVAAGNSIDADSAAPFVNLVLIFLFSLVMHFV